MVNLIYKKNKNKKHTSAVISTWAVIQIDCIVIPTIIAARVVLTFWVAFQHVLIRQIRTKLMIGIWNWIFAGLRNWIQKQIAIKWPAWTIVWKGHNFENIFKIKKKLTNTIFGAWTIFDFCFVKFDAIGNTFTISRAFRNAFFEFIVKQLNALNDFIRAYPRYFYNFCFRLK